MCHSKIGENDVAAKIDEDIFGFDVVVNHVSVLKVGDGGKKLGESVLSVKF